jgi:hypothetical protein
VGVEAAQQQEVAALAVGEQRAGLVEEAADQVGGAFGLGAAGLGVQRRDALALGVGVGQVGGEPVAPQHQQAAVLALGADEQLGAVQAHLAGEQLADAGRLLGGEPAGAAVDDPAIAGEGGEVDARGHVAGLQLEADPGGRQSAAADLVGERVVAEQSQVPGAGPGRDPAGDGVVQAQGALAGEPVEVGRSRLGQLGAPLDGPVAAEAVHDQQQRLAALGPCHLGDDGFSGERHERLRDSRR